MTPLSSFTAITPLSDGTQARAIYFRERFSGLSQNLDQLNSDVSTWLSDLTASDIGWDSGSITTTLDSSAGTLSFITIDVPSSVSTLQVLSQVSVAGAAVFGSTVSLSADPTEDLQAATKVYADALLSGGAPSWRGSWFIGNAAESLTTRDIVYIDSTGSVALADADFALSAPVANIFISLASVAAASDVTCGIVGEAGGFSSLTLGDTYYLSTTAGSIDDTAPSGTSDIVYAVGAALSASTLLFSPQYLASNATV